MNGCAYNEESKEDIEELKRLFYFNRLTQYGKRKLMRYYEQRIKQLEEENKELKHITQNYNAYQQKSDNPNTTIIIADEKWFINGYFKENFIPKSKVKEKIEELKEDEEFYREHDRMYQFESKIKLLQKLLED